MLPKRSPPARDLQQAHTKAQLLLHAEHEKYHLVTQQSTSIRLPPVANPNKQQGMQLQKKRPMPTGRKMPHTKCSLPSHSHNTNIIRFMLASPQILKSATETTQHPFDTKTKETKLNCPNTFGHSKKTRTFYNQVENH